MVPSITTNKYVGTTPPPPQKKKGKEREKVKGVGKVDGLN
jgi:hypothetical protein